MKYVKDLIVRKGIVTGIATFIPLAMFSQNTENHPPPPNVLIILADDLGFGDLSCQGSQDIHTPNIDRIFREGMRFTSFYANSTVCSPTRASLLTGRYPDMVGVPGVIRTDKDDSWGFLSPGVSLLPEMLKKKGYITALIGKWHLGLEAPNLPNLRGFDHFHGFLGDMMDDYFTHLRQGNNYMRLNADTVDPKGHATDIFTDWGLGFLNTQKSDKRPFFMYLAYNAPHDPVQPPDAWILKVKNREKTISEKRAKLVALIEHMDWNIGRILDQLENSGQLENTLVIFTSDNGGVPGNEANNGAYRGGKQDMYEGGIRVPAAFMWKNHIAAGSTFPGMALTMDLFPTLHEIAGIHSAETLDGISLWPALSGQKQETGNRTVFFVRREGNPKYGGMAYYAARSGDYKILQNTPWEPMQFFNLKEDPYEKHPLEKAGNKEYEELFRLLTRHIRLSGAIPWQRSSF
jgi:arylsulfatase A-like enzyme